MKTRFSHTHPLTTWLGILCLAWCVPLAQAVAQDFDFASPTIVFPLNYTVGTPVNETIGITSPDLGANAYWEFTSIPPGATTTTTGSFTTSFSLSGLTVTLPPGVTDANPVPQTDETTIADSGPLIAGSFAFSILVTTEDGLQSKTQTYNVFIQSPMDLVLVFDQSGSMNTTTPAGVTRWDALKESAAGFGVFYQGLPDHANDQLAITYFATNVNNSPCCNGFIAHNNTLGTTINTDLNGQSPGGSTAMGLGLKDAESKLAAQVNGHQKSILLFTDGRQNRNPLVETTGTEYTDGTAIDGNTTICTIGIDGPDMDYHTTLQNLATTHGGSYNTTDDGNAFTFVAGDADGSLAAGFTAQYIDLLAGGSPQLIMRNVTPLPTGGAPYLLQSFPVNKAVDLLQLQFVFNRKFETPQLVQLLAAIDIQREGTSVMTYAQPSWAGNYTNTLLLNIPLGKAVGDQPALTAEGAWTVHLKDVTNFKVQSCMLTSVADDHRLHIKKSHANKAPKVGDDFPITVALDWLQFPVTGATVEVIVLRPGEDLGDLLARDPLIVDVTNEGDNSLPGVQKYEALWQDSTFREKLKRTENLITLAHTENGVYTGVFKDLTVAGVYRILYRIHGEQAETGKFQRALQESVYVSFSSVDLVNSDVGTQLVDNQLILNLRPITRYGRFVGPAAGPAFTVSNPEIKIDQVMDHQDGRYTLKLSGAITANTTLSLLGQPLYTGDLTQIKNFGKDSLFDKIQQMMPLWLFWLLLIIILGLIIWMMMKRKGA